MRFFALLLGLVLLSQCRTTTNESDEKGLAGFGKKNADTSPWTKWPPEISKIRKIYELAGTRDRLFSQNLKDRQGQLPSVTCKPETRNFRTFDGTCNDMSQPGMGMRGLVFSRNSDPERFVKPAMKRDLMNPDPTQVVEALMAKKGPGVKADFLNLYAAAWIQFMTRDWFIRTPQLNVRKEKPYVFKDGLVIAKSNFNERSKSLGHPTTANEATHWWDFSQIYGSDAKTAMSLRTGRGGQMKLDREGVLPSFGYAKVPAPNSETSLEQELSAVPYGGWWLGMSVMYHLFVKEHNYIARQLGIQNPAWSDERLFQTARLVNAALMAKIHTIEWTPAILPNDVARTVLYANWYGVASSKNSVVRQKMAAKLRKWLPDGGENTASFKAAVSGIVGLSNAQHFSVPFTFTEEFTAVYRLHSLIPDDMDIWNPESHAKEKTINVVDTLQAGSLATISNIGGGNKARGLEKAIYSFGKSLPGALVPNNFPNFLRQLPIDKLLPPEALRGLAAYKSRGTIDMAVVDIMRDRERGIPRYNNFRRAIGLKPLTSWNDFVDSKAAPDVQNGQRRVVTQMQRVYNNDLEAVDFVVGCLAEGVRPPGFIFGETQFQIFIAMASRRIFSDRFYTESYTPEVYTQWGIDHVDANNFYHVVVRHFPRMAKYMTDKHKENAFIPWN